MSCCKISCLILLLSCTFSLSSSKRLFYNGRFWNGFLTNVGKKYNKINEFPDLWFNQTLDHFVERSSLWSQRYFVNNKYYRPGGPAFIQIGGEGTANPIWMGVGQWIEFAKEVGAICFMLEHRYYGKSHPTSDLSTSNLRWLTSEQALADLANFRTAMAKKYQLQNAKWVTFGGSYPGSLSAWFRLKYPHLVDVAVSVSSPLQALNNFKEYQVVAGESIKYEGGQACYDSVSNATAQITNLLQHPLGIQLVSKMFKLCKPLNVSNPNDLANFFSTLAGNFDGVVQYNRDNRAFEGVAGTNVTISKLCQMMAGPGTPMERYANVNSLMLSISKESCSDVSYANLMAEMRETSWSSSAASGARQWTFQTCNEFGFYQTSDAKNQPFGAGFPVSFSDQQCSDIYGRNFNLTSLLKKISMTNAFYGAKNYNATKVIFVNGSIDPWHALSLTAPEFTEDRLVIFIEGTAHCANMYPSSPNDLPQLVYARKVIGKVLKVWIS